MTAASEVAILSRIIQPDKPALSREVARVILRWEFPPQDRQYMHALLEKAKAGTLTARGKAEADNYERVGHLLNILQSKARRALKGRHGTNGKRKVH